MCAEANLKAGNAGMQSAAANVVHDDALNTEWQQQLLRFCTGVVFEAQTAATQTSDINYTEERCARKSTHLKLPAFIESDMGTRCDAKNSANISRRSFSIKSRG